MSTIKYSKETFDLMRIFEKITRSKIKDCFVENETAIFVVQPGQIIKALGPKAANTKKLAEKINKKIKIVEYNPNLVGFVESFIRPLKVDDAKYENNILTLYSQDTKTKGLLIGRNAQNLRRLEKNIQRYFPELEEIKIQ